MRALQLKPPLSPAGLSIAVLILIASGVAWANRDSGDRARAEQLLSALQGADPKLVGEPVKNAKDALKRADDMRKAADVEHAELSEGVAFEWAATANDLTRAAKAERELEKLEKQITEADVKTVRARALLEETIARRERAKGKLREFEQEPAQPPAPKPAAPTKPAPKPGAGAKP